MKLTKCFLVIGLCVLMGSCPVEINYQYMNINIGDYDNQLAAWNDQNMLDYQLLLVYKSFGDSIRAFITVKNGIPENSNPLEWLASGEKATVPEFFSFIMEQKERIREEEKLEEEEKFKKKKPFFEEAGFFHVFYDSVYYYPSSISYAKNTTSSERSSDWSWSINMIPLVENEQNKWNSRNMSDYKLSLNYYHNGGSERAVITVRNGVPESSDPPEWLASGEKATVPDFFSFIKEEEERLKEVRAAKDGYFYVVYDPVYHYPKSITTTTDYTGTILYGNDYRWQITLTTAD
jgi:hypothetical protein